MNTTKLKNEIIFALICLNSFAAQAQSSKVIGGLNSAKQTAADVAMVIGPIAFIISGVMFWVNKQVGQEKFTATIIGTFIVGAASSIFSLIYGWVS